MTRNSSQAPLTPQASPEVKVPALAPPGGAGTTSREVPEWIGAKPDTKVPDRVRARVFLAHDGKCFLTGRKIMPADYWQIDHRIALINGGENRETNLAPVLRDAHRIKTRADMQEKSKTARMRNKHLGIKKPRTITAWRKMNGEKVYAARER